MKTAFLSLILILVVTACGDSASPPLEPELAACGAPPCGGGKQEKASAALQFDGTNDVAQTPDAAELDLTDEWTIEAWIRPTDANRSAFQHVISKWNGGGDASYTLEVHQGKLRSAVHDGATSVALESTSSLQNGLWQHVAATFDRGGLSLYIDGNLDASTAGIPSPMNSTRPLSLGREGAPCNCWPFAGAIDDVRIWSTARTGKELRRSMKKLTGKSSGLVAAWSLNEGAGQTSSDETGGGHDMRLGDVAGADSADPAWVAPGR